MSTPAVAPGRRRARDPGRRALALPVAFLVALMAALVTGNARGDEPEDAALTLADRTVAAPQAARDWRGFVEVAVGDAAGRAPGAGSSMRRLSLDLHYDGRLASRWRGVLADRLDLGWQGPSWHASQVNTLQEAYVSWLVRPDRIVDAGRVNLRNGVALSYNPTDWFRAGALRSVVSRDPDSLRSNRLGSVVLRGQALSSSGSVTAVWSPRLASPPGGQSVSPPQSPAFGLDLGATNSRTRWLVSASPASGGPFALQGFLFGQAGQPPQFGLDATVLVNPATVAYLEGAGGNAPSLMEQALGSHGGGAFQARLAAGLTWTSRFKLSLSAEGEFDGAALADSSWRQLGPGAPQLFARYLGTAALQQDPPARRRLFLRAAWQDAGLLHLELTTHAFVDLVDHSHEAWLEARYHWPRADGAVQWQGDAGRPFTEFGSVPARHGWQAVLTFFL